MSRVHHYQADRTNQKLYFARLACQQAEQIQHEHKQYYQAHCEAAVFHLYGAITAFLQELTRYYRLSMIQPSIEAIEYTLAEKGQISPELNQLKSYQQQGFLNALTHTYHHCLYTPETQRSQSETDPALIIKVVQQEQYWLPDVDVLKTWYQDTLKLIETLRENMVEF